MANEVSAAQVAAYRQWVRAEAQKISSDGCTAVSEWHRDCCYEHDLACHYGKDPRVAAQLAFQRLPDYWLQAPYLARRDADKRFAQCNIATSWDDYKKDKGFLQTFKLIGNVTRSGLRYVGVRIGALWPF